MFPSAPVLLECELENPIVSSPEHTTAFSGRAGPKRALPYRTPTELRGVAAVRWVDGTRPRRSRVLSP